ncbi:alpha/beta fold hydrolase [Flavobacteriaceae bacterium]|jgi:homoserine O-acetyltransferase|nr:alpha/beta fold hydrolase [Flavobacteriaceae bacterium]MDC1195419.1 alpha/beta fold hydrolase [Flavobacteriaceae bacterium]MDC1259903.1 alpha/beta fold hydrolase [Flavobacteriaceae bacterium]MDG1385254.1 alpha/beta fold hydrolase [Flavobacteriaceae bacterium]
MRDLQKLSLNYTTQSGKATPIMLSYQTFGKPLHEAPIVMINHALTGNSNVTGKEGWWSPIVGPNKVIDTNVFTIVAFNIPGNGFDQSSNSLIENYKDFTARDIAEIFAIALDQLKINSLFAVIGGSVGGGLAWELAILRPNLIEHLIPVAADWKSTDWLIANCYIQEQLLNNSSQPLVDARMHAMSLYRTPESFKAKFDRITQKDQDIFAVESWLNHHGKVLNERFQLAAYKMMNQVLKTIDITNGRGSFVEVASQIKSNIHIITINSDLFFKAKENWDTYVDLKSHKDNVSISEIQSIHGHDAFLIEYDQVQAILETVFKPQEVY